jgi:NAD(P)-dependent dehydrogenase (short-subunit alcohol dehydrogenase family)
MEDRLLGRDGNMTLKGKMVLITGAARRIGRSMALAVARAGADVVIHYNSSEKDAQGTLKEIQALGRKAYSVQADLSDSGQVADIIKRAREFGSLFALVNNAATFESGNWENSSIEDWNRALAINLTAPFLLCQAFARDLQPGEDRRIVNMLDWRALRPGIDHLPYTITKAAMVALTQSMAVTLAPRVTVNGLALGAILPPSTGSAPAHILDHVPAKRWGDPDEVGQALVFLLDGPAYITGEILHLDGGRHLV